jgi:hypothetical protein
MPVNLMVLALGFVAYLLPWSSAPGASLTLNAYDLAEWSSLHPWVRVAAPPLALTFILRALPSVLALLVLARSPRRWRPWIGLVVLLVAVAQLPPPVFFGPGLNDPNYRQQFTLTLLTMLGIPLSLRLRRWWLQWLLLALLSLGSLVALVNSQYLMVAFAFPSRPGIGGILFVLISVSYGIYIYKRGQPLPATSFI